MIRYINCFRKRKDLNQEEFRKYWQSDEFSELINEVVELTGVIRHTKSLVLKVETSEQLISDRGLSEPFDGILEYWWDNARDLKAMYATDHAKALIKKTQKFQSQFVDFPSSSAFFTGDSN